ncbi:hypothetical protein Tco_1335278 [Tanacetum coccineum]
MKRDKIATLLEDTQDLAYSSHTQRDIDHTADGDLFILIAEEAWETIEDCAKCDKQWRNPTSTISDQSIANLKAQFVGNEMVNVKIPRCMSWLSSTNAYDEPIISLGMMDNEVGNTCPTFLPSFEEYTPLVTCLKGVEETLGTPIEVMFDKKSPEGLWIFTWTILG